MNAEIAPNEIPVDYAHRPDVGRDFLTIRCPNGWDDVKPLTKKVLLFDGRRFTFTGWNSDQNVCYFAAPCDGNAQTAKIVKA